MSRKAKIFILLSLILIALILYLILTSASLKKANYQVQQVKQEQPVKNKSTVMSDEDYKARVKEIFTVYEERAQNKGFTIENVRELKNQLLDFKNIPAKFRDFHINFVLALTGLEDYLNRKDEQVKNTSPQIISQLKADYSWLNN